MQVIVYNLKREEVGKLELSDEVFGSDVKDHLFYEVVKAQLASRGAGTKATKERSGKGVDARRATVNSIPNRNVRMMTRIFTSQPSQFRSSNVDCMLNPVSRRRALFGIGNRSSGALRPALTRV